MTREARCDVLVIGGGVCGLWTLWALLDAGYDAWLIEKSALGDGQTIASQGILHAGAKYGLPGNAVDASRAVAEVQGIWRAALAGESGAPDLSRVRVLDRRMVLWTLPTLRSRVAALGAAVLMRSGVERLARGDWPGGFEGAPSGVEVHITAEMVLEPGSLVAELDRAVRGRTRTLARWHGSRWHGSRWHGSPNRDPNRDPNCDPDPDPARRAGPPLSLEAGPDDDPIRIGCGAVILAAGEGNEGLIRALGGDPAVMQRRPLHQVVAVGAPFELNGHCLQLSLDKPALTVTTGELEGQRTWYLGGGPAEEGVGRSRDKQIEAGRAALARCLPWVDTSGMSWRTFEIDRAEGRTRGGGRPVDAVAAWAAERALAVWPTKLVLAPRAASRVLERLRERGIEPTGVKENAVLASLPEPGVAERVW